MFQRLLEDLNLNPTWQLDLVSPAINFSQNVQTGLRETVNGKNTL